MLCGNAAEQGDRPRSCGCHSVRRQHRPAPRDGLPPLLFCPVQEAFALPSSIEITIERKHVSTKKTQQKRLLPSAATWLIKNLYFFGKLMKGRRALATA